MSTPTPLKFLNPGWFSLVMGMSGLALAWRSADGVLGDMASGVALVLGLLATLAFVALAGASMLRWNRHAQALAEDLRHPVRHAFVATIPVSMLLLSALAQSFDLGGVAVDLLWWVGSLCQLWVTVWVLNRWLAPQTGAAANAGGLWPGITPLLLIAVVGNVVAPLAGIGLGHSFWSAAQFGIGVLFWPLVLGLTLVRRLAHGPLPDRLLPTWFITVTPPSIIGLVLLQYQAPAPLVHGCWGVSMVTLLWVGSQSKRMVGQAFGLPFWAVSFPLAAFASLTLKLAALLASPGLQTVGVLTLAVTSLVVFGLCLATARGLRNGTLLAPEPVANIIPATV